VIQIFKAISNQNIFDVCLSTYGTLEQLPKLLQDNNFGSINNYPSNNQLFNWDDIYVYNEASNIINSANKINYATKSTAYSNQLVIIYPIDYYTIYGSDIRYNYSTNTFTDSYLIGKTGYVIYVQQFDSFLPLSDITYNTTNGSFTINTKGFSLLGGYNLIVYPNSYTSTIVGLPSDPFAGVNYAYYLIYNSDGRYNSGTKTFTDPYLIGKAGYSVYCQQLDTFLSPISDLSYNGVSGSFTINITGFSLLTGYYLIIFPNKNTVTIP
jgi:hypothetical protein